MFLSKEKTDFIRGISVILIILYHLTISGVDNIFMFVFAFGQFIGVAMFFFLSGYALTEQYQIKGDNYLKGFLFKKISRIYVTYLVVFVLYLIYDIFWNNANNITQYNILTSLLSFSFESHRLWYLFAQVIFYIMFYASFKASKRNCVRLISVFLFVALYTVLCIALKFSTTYYFNAVWFPLGICISMNKQKVSKFITKHRFSIFVSSLAALIVMFAFLYLYGYNINGINLYLPIQAIHNVLFITLMVTVTTFNKLVKKFLGGISLIGAYSMELYVTHAAILVIIFDFKLENYIDVLVYFIAPVIMSVILKAVVNKVFELKLFKKENCI